MFPRYPGLFPLIVFLAFCWGCANIVPPAGGPKDVTPPQLVSISPADSQLNTRVTTIRMEFDEYIALNNPATEITVSPILPFPLVVEARPRTVTVRIPDSLLQDQTTYRLEFGEAIRDLNESNPFRDFSYTFSTGAWFDSLSLEGLILDAKTGLPDTAAWVLLYEGVASDSAVLREKPRYAVHASPDGTFRFDGLPSRPFKVYALVDANNNLMFDSPEEKIAFHEEALRPGDTLQPPVLLRTFARADTSDTTSRTAGGSLARTRTPRQVAGNAEEEFTYKVLVDTTDLRRRSQELTRPLSVEFNRPLDSFFLHRISLHRDSSGIEIPVPVRDSIDSLRAHIVLLQTNWQEDALYTLRLLRGFARDTSGVEAMPGRFSFRSKRDDDYAKLQINLPGRFLGQQYLLLVLRGQDTVHHQAVTDTTIHLTRLQPGSFTLRIIADSNLNGYWDPGHLLKGIQPEWVFPHTEPVTLRAGWQNIVDFKEQPPRLRQSGQPLQREQRQ